MKMQIKEICKRLEGKAEVILCPDTHFNEIETALIEEFRSLNYLPVLTGITNDNFSPKILLESIYKPKKPDTLAQKFKSKIVTPLKKFTGSFLENVDVFDIG